MLSIAFAATMLSTMSALSVSAQENQNQERPQRGDRGERGQGGPGGGRFGGGGPGGPGGFGGPGGMMMGAMRAAVDIDRIMVGLPNREEVQKELKLQADQIEALAKLNEKMRPERPNFDFRTASEEERTKFMTKMQEEMTARTKEAKEALEELLLPDQFERLEQIAIQAAGVPALASPAMAEKLGLSKEASDKMTKTIEGSAEKGREMMNAAMRDQNFDGVREKMEQMRKELEEQLLTQLSAEQKAKYEELKGKPFELAQMRGPGGFGGFGGGFGGRGQGGQGGPGGPGGRPQRGDRPQRGERQSQEQAQPNN